MGEDFHFKGQAEFKFSTRCTLQCAQIATEGALVRSSLLPFIFSHHVLTFFGLWILGNIWSLLKLRYEWEIPSTAPNISSLPLLIKMFKDMLDTFRGFPTWKKRKKLRRSLYWILKIWLLKYSSSERAKFKSSLSLLIQALNPIFVTWISSGKFPFSTAGAVWYSP